MKLFGLQIKREKRDSSATVDTNAVATALSFEELLDLVSRPDGLDLPTFYRCVEMIAGSIAQMPINVMNRKQKKISHPVDLIWGNSLLTKYETIHQLMQDMLITGNGYMIVDRAGDGTAKGVRWVRSRNVSVRYDEQNQVLEYTVVGMTRRIEPVNMIHLKFFSYDGINGKGASRVGRNAIQLALSTDAAAQAYFNNNCNLNGILSSSQMLNEKQRAELKSQWKQTYTTSGGGIAVLGGNMSYQAISANANDSQMNESRDKNAIEVCRLFGINPILVGVNAGATYSNFSQAQIAFVVLTLMPYVTMLEAELNKKLFKPSEAGLYVDFDESCLLRADKAAEASYYTQLVTNGILTINEVRHQLGYQPVKGGDDIRIPFSDANQNKVSGDKPSADDDEPADDDKAGEAGEADENSSNNPKNPKDDE